MPTQAQRTIDLGFGFHASVSLVPFRAGELIDGNLTKLRKNTCCDHVLYYVPLERFSRASLALLSLADADLPGMKLNLDMHPSDFSIHIGGIYFSIS
jgi:hypothetical protein